MEGGVGGIFCGDFYHDNVLSRGLMFFRWSLPTNRFGCACALHGVNRDGVVFDDCSRCALAMGVDATPSHGVTDPWRRTRAGLQILPDWEILPD